MATEKGDIVEGTFQQATTTEVVLEVAGQPIHLPLATIKYISFVGRLEGSTAPPPPVSQPRGTADDAFLALDELRGATRVGLLRDQYSEKVADLLPRVNSFVDAPGEEWRNVRRLLAMAVSAYQLPMGRITSAYRNPWTSASEHWRTAARYVDYAKELYGDPKERSHIETVTKVQLTINGEKASGRLGYGDTPLPLADDGGGSAADSYSLVVPTPMKLAIVATSAGGGDILLYVIGPEGKRIAKEDGLVANATRDLKPGTYTIWVSSRAPAKYSLFVRSAS